MIASEIGFWVCAAIIGYTYIAYPLLVGLVAWARPRPVRRVSGHRLSVSFIVCAYNEEAHLERRLLELKHILTESELDGEIIVVSDGSTDRTAAIAQLYSGEQVRLLELPGRVGKAVALSRGVEAARFDICVFADVRQMWARNALSLLLENFADPTVGAVSGDLVLLEGPRTMAGVGLYWRYEKWIRQQESALGCQVGVTGAISAVRRELFRGIPAGILLDDVYWPLVVARQGYRVVHDDRARAYDRLPEHAADEFRRKVRTLTGNFQLATRMPEALLPWRNPVWLQLVSHKLLRLVVPWALITLLVLSVLLARHWWYAGCLAAQLAGYGLALMWITLRQGGRLASAAASVVVLNTAAWLAFWIWITGRAQSTWGKIEYVPLSKPVAV